MKSLTLPVDTGNLEAGQVYAANGSRFEAAHFQDALTDYSVGATDPEDLDVLIQLLAPAIPNCPRRFEYFKADSKQAFLADDIKEVIRNVGGEFKRVENFGEMVTDRIHNKGLVTRLDYEALDAGVNREQARQQKVAMLQNRLRRADVRQAVAIHIANATNLAKTWDAASNPHKDLRDSLTLGANGSGMRPTSIIFGEGAHDRMMDVYESQDTPYAGRAAGMSKMELASKFGVRNVDTVSARYAASASSRAQIIGNQIFLFIAYAGQQLEDASHIKRFIAPVIDGGDWGVYIQESSNWEDITVQHNSLIRSTSTVGERMLTIS